MKNIKLTHPKFLPLKKEGGYNKQAFTLVELIVVITILAILWTIAFISLQWYSKEARDSTRIANVNNIVLWSELFLTHAWKPPVPDNIINIYLSGWLFLEQWEVWTWVLDKIWVTRWWWTDPKTWKNFIYSRNNLSYSVLAHLEWWWTAWIIEKSYAVNYTGTTLYTKWSDAWIILNEDKSPLTTDLDIYDLQPTDKYIISYTDSTFEATKSELKTLAILNNKILSTKDDSLAWYWPMDSITNDNKFEDMSGYGNDCNIWTNTIVLEDWFAGKAANTSYSDNPNVICWNTDELNSSSFTISMFVKVLWYDSYRRPEFLSRWSWHLWAAFLMKEYWTHIYFEYALPPYSWSTYTWVSYNSINKNIWTNIVYSYNNITKDLKVYQNWKIKEIINNVDITPNNLNFYLYKKKFNWLIDEAKVYQRTLSDEEVKLMFRKYF